MPLFIHNIFETQQFLFFLIDHQRSPKTSHLTTISSRKNYMKTIPLCADQIVTIPSDSFNRKRAMYFVHWLLSTEWDLERGFPQVWCYHISGCKIVNGRIYYQWFSSTLYTNGLRWGQRDAGKYYISPPLSKT